MPRAGIENLNQRNRNRKERKRGRKTYLIVVQQLIHHPVYIRRVPDEMDDPISDRSDDNLGFGHKVDQSGSLKVVTETVKKKRKGIGRWARGDL